MFSHRAPKGVWQLYVMSADGTGAMAKLTPDDRAEWQGAVSPDGTSVAFMSDRDVDVVGAADLWVRPMPAAGASAGAPVRLTSAAGIESHPAWAPDSIRVAYQAVRPGLGSGVWVSEVPKTPSPPAPGRGGRGGRPGGPGGQGPPPPPVPLAASRHGGVPAWSPDGEWLAIATFPVMAAQHNGNPNRTDADLPMVTADASAFELWRVLAPRTVDQGATTPTLPSPDATRWAMGFDQIWQERPGRRTASTVRPRRPGTRSAPSIGHRPLGRPTRPRLPPSSTR